MGLPFGKREPEAICRIPRSNPPRKAKERFGAQHRWRVLCSAHSTRNHAFEKAWNMISQSLLASVAIVAIYSLVGAWIASVGDQSSEDMLEWSSSYGAAGLAISAFEGLLSG